MKILSSKIILTAIMLASPVAHAAYCTSSGGGSYEWIAGVKVGSFNNTSTGASPYTDFTSKTANLVVGANSTTLTPGFTSGSYTEHWAVYIDFNKDDDFTDAGEKVFTGSGTSAVNGTITVPAGSSGTTRMRVSMKYQQAVPGPCGGLTSGEVEDYTVSIAGGGGNIAPVARTDGPYSGTKGTGIPMSSNASTDSDGNIVTWHWDFGDGTISNSANPNHVFNTAGTFNVTLTVTDNGGATNATTTTATITDTTTPPPSGYCSVTGGGTYEWIAGVKVGSFNNTSAQSNYGNYTSLTAALTSGSNTLTLTPGFTSGTYTEHWGVWIDYNKDGDFTDAGEQVVSGLNGKTAVTASFTVPTSATGTTRMRVGMKYNQAVTDPCANIASGEFEDYTVSFGGTPPPPPPSGDMPDMCATTEPTTASSLEDGVPVCVKSTNQFTSFSIASGTPQVANIAITTSYGQGNLILEGRSGGGWPKPGDDSVRSSHVGNTECIIVKPTQYWTNITLRGLFKGATVVADLDTTKCRATPGAADPGNDGYKFNNVHVVIYPIRFNSVDLDFTTAQINAEMQKTLDYYKEQSYGNFNVTWEIKPKITMPLAKSVYDNDKPKWNPGYKAELIKAGVDPDFPGEGKIVMVTAPPIGTVATNYINSQAGPPLMEIYTYKAGTIAHEMGHALGLHHSMSVEGGNSTLNGNSNDKITNYGNVFAMMGMGAHTLEEFNLMYKSYFKNWIKTSDAPLITTSGTYRIYAFDHGTAAGTNAPGAIGLRLKSGDGKNTYWVEYRTTTSTEDRRAGLENGVLVNLQGYMDSNITPWWNHTSLLLDMTPNSKSTANWLLEDETDAPLQIGNSFTDKLGNGFRITPQAKGGAMGTAGAWIDVQVEIF